jgi:hypothetical protein
MFSKAQSTVRMAYLFKPSSNQYPPSTFGPNFIPPGNEIRILDLNNPPSTFGPNFIPLGNEIREKEK